MPRFCDFRILLDSKIVIFQRFFKNNKMKSLNIAILGCGTVGGGVAQIISEINKDLDIRANKKIVLSVIEYLKDKEQKDVDEYIEKFKLPKKFTIKDIIEKTRSYESEQIDFRIEDIIGDEIPAINMPPVVPPAPPVEEKPLETEQTESPSEA